MAFLSYVCLPFLMTEFGYSFTLSSDIFHVSKSYDTFSESELIENDINCFALAPYSSSAVSLIDSNCVLIGLALLCKLSAEISLSLHHHQGQAMSKTKEDK